MNTELKALIKMSVDLFSAGKLAVEKADFVTKLIPALYAVAMDVPAVVTGASGLMEELKALGAAEADADLIAYIMASVAGVTDDAKAKAVLAAVLTAVEHVVLDVVAIEKALSAEAAPSA